MAGFEETGIAAPLRTAAIAGGGAGAHTVTGIKLGDKLCSVLHFTPSTSIADLTSEFSITADDTIDNTGGTATTSDFLIVFYWDNPTL